MRCSPAPGEPFGIRLWFEPGEIGSICQDALYAAGRMPETVGPVEIDLFIEQYFSVPIEYADLGRGIVGCTAFDGEGRVRRICASTAHYEIDDEKVAERWVRATLAHEAGHGLLHGAIFANVSSEEQVADTNYDFREQRVMCREDDMRGSRNGYDGRWWEWQANRAIGGLLMPLDLVNRWLAKEGLVTLTDTGAVAAGALLDGEIAVGARKEIRSAMAETFDVNDAVVAIRTLTLAGLNPLYEGLTTEVPTYQPTAGDTSAKS